jgi:hypothetical protein
MFSAMTLVFGGAAGKERFRDRKLEIRDALAFLGSVAPSEELGSRPTRVRPQQPGEQSAALRALDPERLA